MSGNLQKARAALWGIAAISYAVTLVLVAASGMRWDYGPTVLPLAVVCATLVLSSVYCSLRNMLTFRSALETTLIGFLLTVPCVVSTYLAIGVNMPLADAQLAGLDERLGFQWAAFVAFVDSRPWLAEWLAFSYRSFPMQLLFLPALISLCGRGERAYRMVAGYGLICFFASFIAIWFPAVGAYPYYKVAAADLQNINMHFGYFFLEQFNGIRDNPDFVFSMSRAAGILTFPSVHAAVAVLCAWAAWDIRLLRYPMLVLNIGMAIGAVSHGSHYLVDVPAGILLAATCIAVLGIGTRSPSPATGPRVALAV